MIIADDAAGFNAGTDQKVDQDRFKLCLTGLEIVATDEDSARVGKFQAAWDECVLGRAIDV